jgi:hypothetical protein
MIITIIKLTLIVCSLWIAYHANKDKLTQPLQKLKMNIDAFVNNHYVKFTMSLANTIITFILIFLSFSMCFCMWVLKFNQSAVGLCVSLFLFSVMLLGSIFYYVSNQDLADN